MTKRVDFADLARRCREAPGKELVWPETEELFAELAEVLDHIGPAIEGMSAVIEANRADAILKTVHNIASVADATAKDYLHGHKPISTAHGALRMFAASLRESMKPKEAAAEKKSLVLQ